MTLAVLMVGCNAQERISRLEKQNQQLQAEIKNNQAATDFDLQAKCARDSKTWFNENWGRGDKDTILLTFTNHYNRVQNKCFILVEYHYSFEKGTTSWANHMTLWDAYENLKYGEFSERHQVVTKPESRIVVSVDTCEVFGKECKTADEFNNIVRPFMND
jgi:hypothetical protein